MARYAVDPVKGTLTFVGHMPSGGRTPRNITIDPTNGFLIAANQNGENIVVFRIDPKTGDLTPTGATGQVPQPGGVYFVKAQYEKGRTKNEKCARDFHVVQAIRR